MSAAPNTVDLAAPPASARLRSLDGLRGVAALVVVLHHCMLTWSSFASTYNGSGVGAPVGSLLWWVTQTPLKLLTAGGEAVTIFFVLSGVVLTVPTLGPRRFDWWGYYPRRMVRLYLPVIAAVLFATVLAWTWPVIGNPKATWWVILSTVPHPTAGTVVSAMDLLGGSPALDNPLWSLKWEVLFSLLLPVVIGVAVLSKRRPWVAIVLAAVAIAIGVWLGDVSLMYLPVFVGGAAIAVSLPALRERADRWRAMRGSGLWSMLLLVAALLALIIYWLVRPYVAGHQAIGAVLDAISFGGAVLIVVIAAMWTPVVRLLTTRIVQWLGRISFSIYLIHVPILVTYNAFLGPRLWWVSALCTVATALVFAELFARFIEQPAHRLAGRTGRFFSRLIDREKGVDATAPAESSDAVDRAR